MAATEEELRHILQSDEGNPAFAELAERLRREGRSTEALQLCLRGLSRNEACHQGRLVLARLYFEQDYLPFAEREIEFLCRELPESKTLRKLLDKMAPGRGQSLKATETPLATVAETDFSFEDLDLLDEDKRDGEK